jgi:hypothetical protein
VRASPVRLNALAAPGACWRAHRAAEFSREFLDLDAIADFDAYW